MNRIGSLITFGALLTTATLTFGQSQPANDAAQQQTRRIQQLFQELDKNRDGSLDAREAQAERGLKNAFPRLASNGKVSEERFIDWYRIYDRPPAEE